MHTRKLLWLHSKHTENPKLQTRTNNDFNSVYTMNQTNSKKMPTNNNMHLVITISAVSMNGRNDQQKKSLFSIT